MEEGGGEAKAPPPNGDLVGFLPDGQSVEQLWCGNCAELLREPSLQQLCKMATVHPRVNCRRQSLSPLPAPTVVANSCHYCYRRLSPTFVANCRHHCYRQLSSPTLVVTAFANCRQLSSPTVVTTAIANCIANCCRYCYRQLSSPTAVTTAIANCRQQSRLCRWQL